MLLLIPNLSEHKQRWKQFSMNLQDLFLCIVLGHYKNI